MLFSIYTAVCILNSLNARIKYVSSLLVYKVKMECGLITKDLCGTSRQRELTTLYFVNMLENWTILMYEQAVNFFSWCPTKPSETCRYQSRISITSYYVRKKNHLKVTSLAAKNLAMVHGTTLCGAWREREGIGDWGQMGVNQNGV